MARYRSGRFNFTVTFPASSASKVLPVFEKYEYLEDVREIKLALQRYNADTFDVGIGNYKQAFIKELLPLLSFDVPTQNQLKAFLKLLENPKQNKVGKLALLPTAIAKILAENPIDGWLYKNEGNQRIPYAVDTITYHSAERDDERPSVNMRLVFNTPRSSSYRNEGASTTSVTFFYDDIVGKTAGAVLLDAGYMLETPELKTEYLAYWERYLDYRPQYGKQFSAVGAGEEEVGSSDEEEFEPKTKIWASRLVMNDVSRRNFTLRKSANEFAKYALEAASEDDVEDDLTSEVQAPFTSIPVHPFLYLFDLNKHTNSWYHVRDIQPYKYDKTVIDKLVLPPSHRDLIETLTADLSIFAGDEDVVRGKSGGTPILCYGEPGLGKTLTAEVYSELAEKPLYRVHSGQLGTTFETVEKNLEIILKRAESWGCILLLDEADVYISKRGGDLARNAVVAAFLRTLEYFNGLMFLTTNRMDDIDDAVLSRMIAMVRYERPHKGSRESVQLWKVLSRQFDTEFKPEEIDQLITTFGELSGRDIKQLIRLTARYKASKGIEGFDLKAYQICAMFRGMN